MVKSESMALAHIQNIGFPELTHSIVCINPPFELSASTDDIEDG
jgi:hypothetical protein